MEHISFYGHETQTNGAAILLQKGTYASLNGCSFKKNIALLFGGAIFADFGGDVSVHDSVFEYNVAVSGSGGAIKTNGELHIIRATFTGNRAASGGAVSIQEYDMQGFTNRGSWFENSFFYENSAVGKGGGAVQITNSIVNIVGCLFQGNRAVERVGGGAVLFEQNKRVHMANVVSKDNDAGGAGDEFRFVNAQNCSLRNISYGDDAEISAARVYVSGSPIDSCKFSPCPKFKGQDGPSYGCEQVHGNSVCMPCRSLFYSLDGIKCELGACPPGTQANSDSSNCEACPQFSYSSDFSMTKCKKCGGGGVLGYEASADGTACICNEGYYQYGKACLPCDDEPQGDEAIVCPGGMYEGDHLARIYPRSGFYIMRTPTVGATNCSNDAPCWARCLERQTCIGFPELQRAVQYEYSEYDLNNDAKMSNTELSHFITEISANSSLDWTQLQNRFCQQNSHGHLCSKCTPEFATKRKGVCADCSTTVFGAMKWFLNAAFISFLLEWKAGQIDTRSDGGKLSILVFFMQALLQLSDKSGPNQWYGLRAFLDGLINLESSSSGGTSGACTLKLSAAQDLYMTVIVSPLIIVVLVLTRYQLKKIRRNYLKTDEHHDDLVEGTAQPTTAQNKPGLLAKVQTYWQSTTKQAELGFFMGPNELVSSAGSIIHRDEGQQITRAAALSDWWSLTTYAMVEQQAWRNCQRTLLESLIFLYIAVSKKVIAMAICVKVGEVNHVLADPAMTCMDETHLPARLLSFFVIICFTIGFPIYNITHSQPTEEQQMMPWLHPARFDPWVRYKYIYNERNRFWQATLQLRKVILVLAVILVQVYGEDVHLWGKGQDSTVVQTKTMSFAMFSVAIVLQAIRQPYTIREDNVMEQCVLVALMTSVYFDITRSSHEGSSALQLNTIMVALLVVAITCVWALQMPARKVKANLSKAGFHTEIVTAEEMPSVKKYCRHPSTGLSSKSSHKIHPNLQREYLHCLKFCLRRQE